MHGLKNERKQSINLALNDGDDVGEVEEGARGGRPLAVQRRATGRAISTSDGDAFTART